MKLLNELFVIVLIVVFVILAIKTDGENSKLNNELAYSFGESEEFDNGQDEFEEIKEQEEFISESYYPRMVIVSTKAFNCPNCRNQIKELVRLKQTKTGSKWKIGKSRSNHIQVIYNEDINSADLSSNDRYEIVNQKITAYPTTVKFSANRKITRNLPGIQTWETITNYAVSNN